MPQTSAQAKKTPKKSFRINFYGFLIIIALLLAAVTAIALRMQNETAQFHNAKQAQRASIDDIKLESKKIDAVWQKLAPSRLIGYSSAEQECLKKEDNAELSTCLPDTVYAKLRVTSDQPILTVADTLANHFKESGWQQQSYKVKTSNGEKSRDEVDVLPVNFQSVRFYYVSPGGKDERRCASLIYSSKEAQTPGWNGYVGKCSF